MMWPTRTTSFFTFSFHTHFVRSGFLMMWPTRTTGFSKLSFSYPPRQRWVLDDVAYTDDELFHVFFSYPLRQKWVLNDVAYTDDGLSQVVFFIPTSSEVGS